MEKLLMVLSFIIVFQQTFFMWQIHKLVNKLMCRSYTEYENATKELPPKIQLPEEPLEDMGVLANY